jgi:hypothetical protein
MSVELVKTESNPCLKCGCKDFKAIRGAKACVECFTYVPKELIRDIKK